MAKESFAHVPTEGFAAFGAEMSSGVWGSIDVASYIGADGRAAQALGTAPTFVALKLQLHWPITALVLAKSGAGTAKQCDDDWDGTQKLLDSMITVGLASKDAQHKAAAERLQKVLLLGEGQKQTQLKYHQEVDFGRQQVHLMSSPAHNADVVLLGLQTVQAQIASATNALANAIGYGATGLAPAKRAKAATTDCVNAFGAVARQLEWLAEFGLEGADRQKALALHAALMDLPTRYPARPAVKPVAMPATPASAPAPAVP